jgi:hypothetical protein
MLNHIRTTDELKLIQDDLFNCILKLVDKVQRDIDAFCSKETSELKENDLGQVGQIVSQCSILLKTVHELATDIVIETQNDLFLRDFKSTQIHMLSIFKALQNALNSSDLIVLNDLLEYELKDTLRSWKHSLIPSIKARMTDSTKE